MLSCLRSPLLTCLVSRDLTQKWKRRIERSRVPSIEIRNSQKRSLHAPRTTTNCLHHGRPRTFIFLWDHSFLSFWIRGFKKPVLFKLCTSISCEANKVFSTKTGTSVFSKVMHYLRSRCINNHPSTSLLCTPVLLHDFVIFSQRAFELVRNKFCSSAFQVSTITTQMYHFTFFFCKCTYTSAISTYINQAKPYAMHA